MAAPHASQRTQVLVVGAGPVGLLAALRLRQQGIDVRVIEQQTELSTRTFPVVLHPQSLRILVDLGLSPALFWRGRPLSRLAVYTDQQRRAVLELPNVSGSGVGALTLPQDVLRQALHGALSRLGVSVEYSTRLSMLAQDSHSVWGRLAHQEPAPPRGPGPTATTFDADYVIGADGYESTAREALGAELIDYGALTSFAFFDASTPRAGRDALIALSDRGQHSVYPVRDGVSRFSFQLDRSLDRAPDEQLLRELLAARLPWFSGEVERCSWCGVAEFRRALTDHFGRGRIWLAGEAAHLTGPLGVQSLNVGMDEADELARAIADTLIHSRTTAFGPEYEARRRRQWRELLGLDQRAAPSDRSPEWASQHLPRLVACLPASEADLDDLLDQLRLSTSAHRAQLQ